MAQKKRLLTSAFKSKVSLLFGQFTKMHMHVVAAILNLRLFKIVLKYLLVISQFSRIFLPCTQQQLERESNSNRPPSTHHCCCFFTQRSLKFNLQPCFNRKLHYYCSKTLFCFEMKAVRSGQHQSSESQICSISSETL